MFNKNLLLGLAVVVLLVGGILFGVFNNNSLNTNPPAATSGELNRPLARQLILNYYATEPEFKNDKVNDVIITGITTENPSNALVYFDVEFDVSGKITKETSPVAMPFALYDDGWRIDFARYIK